MTTSFTMQALCEHFAHCVQVLGGTTTSSRRLDINERAIRRFINGELPLSTGLLQDTAKALSVLIAEATAAEAYIAQALASELDDPQLSPSKRDAAPS